MTLRATILIPTHNHEQMLRHAAHSALRQTAREIEVFIMGDGMNDGTRRVAQELALTDTRVRLFDHPKGPRLGEVYRHAALTEARGRIVCYLCDDDLWLPHHVETMEALLADADFAHALSVVVAGDGGLSAGNEMHFALPGMGEMFVAREPKIGGAPLSCIAHTMDLYRRLAVGWDTTPRGTATDTFMARKLVGHPGCRAVTSTRPTLLRFPSPTREDMSLEQRVSELAAWADRVADPGWVARLPLEVLDAMVLAHTSTHVALQMMKARLLRAKGQVQRAREDQVETAVLAEREARCAEERARLQASVDQALASERQAAAELARLRGSVAVRVGHRLKAVPVLGGLLRAVARVMA
jgi:GalNAc5-diNAcBac-PP-undecaprenol beta-1,3-glucosyltransferase